MGKSAHPHRANVILRDGQVMDYTGGQGNDARQWQLLYMMTGSGSWTSLHLTDWVDACQTIRMTFSTPKADQARWEMRSNNAVIRTVWFTDAHTTGRDDWTTSSNAWFSLGVQTSQWRMVLGNGGGGAWKGFLNGSRGPNNQHFGRIQVHSQGLQVRQTTAHNWGFMLEGIK